MNTPTTALLSALPLAAGWAVHVRWLRGCLDTARRDPLTGLRTRDGFTRRATALLKDPRAVVVLADVDKFKHINDTHGHGAGPGLPGGSGAMSSSLNQEMPRVGAPSRAPRYRRPDQGNLLVIER